MKVLSIDFDYFIDATPEQTGFFPDGGREMGDSLNRIVWAINYATAKVNGVMMNEIHADMKKLLQVREILAACPSCPRMIADSHVHAHDFILEHLKDGQTATIYNLDFHHDTYAHGDQDLNCGNWLLRLILENKTDKVFWVNRHDSASSGKEKSIQRLPFKNLPRKDYDLIYICRSGWWTPPTLDNAFIRTLVKPTIKEAATVRIERGIDQSRDNTEFRDAVASFYEVQKNIETMPELSHGENL